MVGIKDFCWHSKLVAPPTFWENKKAEPSFKHVIRKSVFVTLKNLWILPHQEKLHMNPVVVQTL